MKKLDYIVTNYNKNTKGMKVGISKGVQVEDLLNGIIVISESERSQILNKEKCFDVINAYNNSKELLEGEDSLAKIDLVKLINSYNPEQQQRLYDAFTSIDWRLIQGNGTNVSKLLW